MPRIPIPARRPALGLLLALAAAAGGACGDADPHPDSLVRGWRLSAGTVGQGVQPVAVDIGREGRLAGTYQVARDGRVDGVVRRIEGGTWRVRPADDGGGAGPWLCLRYALGAPERCAPYEVEGGARLAWGPLTLEPVGRTEWRVPGGITDEISEGEIETAEAPIDTTEIPDTIEMEPEDTAADPGAAPSSAAPSSAAPTSAAPTSAAPSPTTSSSAATPSAARPRRGPTAPSHADSLARCDAAGRENQRACLLALIAENDVGLQRAYRELTAALARRPGELRALRAQQREWILRRDRVCRERTLGSEGRFWGTVRATCFGELSERRTEELERRLELVRERAAQGLR